MGMLLRIDINVVAFLVLLALLLNIYIYKEKRSPLNRLFVMMMLFTMIELLLETAACVINKRPEPWAMLLAEWLHVLLFALAPASAMLWCLFVDYWIYQSWARLRNKAGLFLIPLILNALLALTSPDTGYLFNFASGNVYLRGPLFFIPVVTTYLLLMYSFIFIILNRKKLRREELLPLLIFPVPPAIGGLLQVLFYGFLLLWSGMAFTMVIVYIYLQQQLMQLDSITGAWTRRAIDNYLEYRMGSSAKGKDFSAILFDLDNFKEINDNYGHLEGDRVLKNVVDTVKQCLRKEDLVARYGGDEFIIILEVQRKEDLEKEVKRIKQEFQSYNETSGEPYHLEFSCGYDIYHSGSGLSAEQFIQRLDSIMYKAKHDKRKTQ